jgi:hypothetical protein
MATRSKPKARKLKFELSRSGVGGIGVILFCLFLWMFLLGVWAGQSLLVPSYSDTKAEKHEQQNDISTLVIRADKKVMKKNTNENLNK